MLDEHIERSTLAAARLDASSTARKVPTDRRSVTEIAAEILASAGWLPGTTIPANDAFSNTA